LETIAQSSLPMQTIDAAISREGDLMEVIDI
jgi:hypothetical protein